PDSFRTKSTQCSIPLSCIKPWRPLFLLMANLALATTRRYFGFGDKTTLYSPMVVAWSDGSSCGRKHPRADHGSEQVRWLISRPESKLGAIAQHAGKRWRNMSETGHAPDRERSSVYMWYRHAVSRYSPATRGTSGVFFIFSRIRIQHSVRVSIVAMEQ